MRRSLTIWGGISREGLILGIQRILTLMMRCLSREVIRRSNRRTGRQMILLIRLRRMKMLMTRTRFHIRIFNLWFLNSLTTKWVKTCIVSQKMLIITRWLILKNEHFLKKLVRRNRKWIRCRRLLKLKSWDSLRWEENLSNRPPQSVLRQSLFNSNRCLN